VAELPQQELAAINPVRGGTSEGKLKMENTKPTKNTPVTAKANAYGNGALELSGVGWK